MILRSTVLFLLLGIFANALCAQQLSQTIKGRVQDADSKIPLIGVTVQVQGSEPIIGTATDLDGKFILTEVPVGRQTIQFSYLGYEDAQRSEVLVGSGKEVFLSMSLSESVITLKEATVRVDRAQETSINSMATISARVFSVEETSRYAASFNDPARMAVSFAGVSAGTDEDNSIIVRGNSPRGVLWRLEGIEIPNPNHFNTNQGSSGGGISTIPNTMLSNSDFFTGAFPAEYGNALSSVFDLQFRNGNSEKREYALQGGVLGMQAAMEGPFSKRKQASYLINYRYSTVGLLNAWGLNIAGEDAIAPIFQDVGFKFHLPTEQLGTFDFFGLGGISTTGDRIQADSSLWEGRYDKYGEEEINRTGMLGASNLYLFKNGKTYLKTVGLFSMASNTFTEDTLDYNYKSHTVYSDQFDYPTLRGSVLLNHKFNSRHLMRIGIIASHLRYDVFGENLDVDASSRDTLANENGSANTLQGYAQWQFRPNSSLTINTGVHWTKFLLNSHYALEPRLGLRWQFATNMAFSAGVGLHSSIEALSLYLAQKDRADGSNFQPNIDLGFSRSAQFVVGLDWNPFRDFRIKTEAYYQYQFNVPVGKGTNGYYSLLNLKSGFSNQALVNEGTGYNYGLEITAEKFFSRNYYFLTTLSFFDSRFNTFDDKSWPTLFNNNYVVNLLAGREFLVGRENNNRIGLNGRLIWRGGQRRTAVDLAASQLAGEEVLVANDVNGQHLKDYLRLDIGFNYTRNKPKYSWILSLDVQNCTNRSNLFDQGYDEMTGALWEESMLGLIPVLNYRVEF